MRDPFAESPEFGRLLNDEARADVVRVALEIARDAYPGLDIEHYLAHLDTLASRVRDRCIALNRPRQVLGQINWVLFVEERFTGNSESYYDPRNSYLNEVIDRKTGIPISLSVLYARVAEQLGLTVAGMNLPAHFMLRVETGREAIFVDAFHSGALLDRDGCQRQIERLFGREIVLNDEQFAPCRAREVVARMLRNLKAVYLQGQDYVSAIPVQRRLAALSNNHPEEVRDLGLLFLRAERLAEAAEWLQLYVESDPAPADAEQIVSLLRAARREVAIRN